MIGELTSVIERLPNWLRGALGYRDPQIPAAMVADSILGVIDVGQGGWGDNDVRSIDNNLAGAVGTSADIITNTNEEAALLLGLRLAMTVAGARTTVISVVPATGSNIHMASVAVAATGNFNWKDISGGVGQTIYVPPGAKLNVTTALNVAGDNQGVIAYYVKLRPGYRPR